MLTPKMVLGVCVGTGLEFYDFIIYGLLASYISQIFFNHADPSLALIQTFAVFATGYIMKPVGGLVFGIIGDKYGRKISFIISVVGMGFATLLIGFLPTQADIGIYAGMSLLFLRCLQGFCYGGEIPGAITFLNEHANRFKRGILTSFISSSMGVSAVFSVLLIMLMTSFLSFHQIIDWGWRIPFWIGGILAFIGLWLRQELEETPYFIAHQQTIANQTTLFTLKLLLKHHFKAILQGLGIILFSSCLVTFMLGSAAFLNTYFGYSLPVIYKTAFITMLFYPPIAILAGKISDHINRKTLLAGTCLLFTIGSYFLFNLLNHHTLVALFCFNLILQSTIAMLNACYMPMLSELFPTSVRYSGIGLCFNFGASISGLSPLIINSIMYFYGQITYIALFFCLFSVVSLVASYYLGDHYQKELT